ncbi:MAG: putative glycoside hydrolase [Endomicrobium sp.]|nr:putative glycoside hydrolase [Endomicrobium sp.]
MQKIKFILLLFFILQGCITPSANSNNRVLILENPQEEETISNQIAKTTIASAINNKQRFGNFIRGIHLSAWVSGSKKYRETITDLFNNTELNTAVIDIKEYEGNVYINGIKDVNTYSLYESAMPDIEQYIKQLKEKGIYTIARIVVFRDNAMSRKKPELAVKNPDGTIWTDRRNVAWLDPYNKEAWKYNLQIAKKAADIGFDEIQFDYIRFPSDGNTKNCRYSKPHSPTEASKALVGFLKEANNQLKPKGTKISIDVFGLTTTANDDLGIGQKIIEMTEFVDYVSPMVYPSHYGKWNYGIEEPNKEPYKIVYYSIEGALKRVSPEKLRPWLQYFTLGYKYGKNEVRAQMQACYDNKIGSWLLWNPRCIYTKDALKDKKEEHFYLESDPSTLQMLKTANNLKTKINSDFRF